MNGWEMLESMGMSCPLSPAQLRVLDAFSRSLIPHTPHDTLRDWYKPNTSVAVTMPGGKRRVCAEPQDLAFFWEALKRTQPVSVEYTDYV